MMNQIKRRQLLLLCFFNLFGVFVSQQCNEEGVCFEGDRVIPRVARADGKPPEAPKDCVDRHPNCKLYHKDNQCKINPGWMIVNCPLSCKACHLRDPRVRCDKAFLNITEPPALFPGRLDQIFETILLMNNTEFGVITLHSRSPWVVTFDHFLTNAEADALVKTVSRWERSTDTGPMNEYGEAGRQLSNGRTSSNAWCREDCEANPYVQSVISKIERVTQVPYDNYESFQILRYEKTQRYVPHHDSSEEDYQMSCGPRILTMFLYLSDVEEGGNTSFPSLGISVKPKKGKALLWPGVMNDNPGAIDYRTMHEAQPVIKGTKYAANSWIHMNNFRIPNLWGCTGAFD